MNWANTYQAELDMSVRVRDSLGEVARWNRARLARSSSRPTEDSQPAVEGWRLLAERGRLAWDAFLCGFSGLAFLRAPERAC